MTQKRTIELDEGALRLTVLMQTAFNALIFIVGGMFGGLVAIVAGWAA